MSIERRTFLQSVGALACAAVVPAGLQAVPPRFRGYDQDRTPFLYALEEYCDDRGMELIAYGPYCHQERYYAGVCVNRRRRLLPLRVGAKNDWQTTTDFVTWSKTPTGACMILDSLAYSTMLQMSCEIADGGPLKGLDVDAAWNIHSDNRKRERMAARES